MSYCSSKCISIIHSNGNFSYFSFKSGCVFLKSIMFCCNTLGTFIPYWAVLAIRASFVATEWVKGKSIDEVVGINRHECFRNMIERFVYRTIIYLNCDALRNNVASKVEESMSAIRAVEREIDALIIKRIRRSSLQRRNTSKTKRSLKAIRN